MKRTKIRSRALGRLVAALLPALGSGAAVGQELLLHLPLDGALTSQGSIAAAPRMYVDDGEAAPEVVPGHIGDALEFNSRATVAVPFNLDHSDYPAVTITAWVRQALAASDTRAILSSGSTAGASLGVNGGRLAARAGRTGVSFDQDMPNGEWVFVAAVIDVANSYARLHQNDAVLVREGMDTSAAPPREYRNPDNPDADPQAYLFVGAAQFRNWQQAARRIAIDEVRLYAGALSEDQINAIRDGSAIGAPGAESSELSDTGRTLEEMQAEAAARNANVTGDLSIGSPTDILPEAGEQASTTNAPSAAEEALGPTGGAGDQQIGDFLLNLDFEREPTGNVRDCTSFAEVVADLAATVRDNVVEFAATNACGLLTRSVAESQAARQLQSVSGYETPEFQEQLIEETYDRCVGSTTAASQLPDRMLGFWNNAVGRDSWATIGPRELRFGETHNGNIIAPGDRKYLSAIPTFGRDTLDVALAEIEGQARVNLRVCSVSMNNEYRRLTSVTINETQEEQDNESQYIVETFDDFGSGFVIVYMDGARIGRNFRYELTVD